jgi:hypothetical protein
MRATPSAGHAEFSDLTLTLAMMLATWACRGVTQCSLGALIALDKQEYRKEWVGAPALSPQDCASSSESRGLLGAQTAFSLLSTTAATAFV